MAGRVGETDELLQTDKSVSPPISHQLPCLNSI